MGIAGRPESNTNISGEKGKGKMHQDLTGTPQRGTNLRKDKYADKTPTKTKKRSRGRKMNKQSFGLSEVSLVVSETRGTQQELVARNRVSRRGQGKVTEPRRKKKDSRSRKIRTGEKEERDADECGGDSTANAEKGSKKEATISFSMTEIPQKYDKCKTSGIKEQRGGKPSKLKKRFRRQKKVLLLIRIRIRKPTAGGDWSDTVNPQNGKKRKTWVRDRGKRQEVGGEER